MPGIEIRNLPRTTDIDDIYNGLVPLSINNETVAAVFGTALGSVTNCLNTALYFGESLSGGFVTLSSIQITNNAKIENLLTQALTANSCITQQGHCLDAKADLTCFTTLNNKIETNVGSIATNRNDLITINNSINDICDCLTLKATTSSVDRLDQCICTSNTCIENLQNDISVLNTCLLTKAGNTSITAINIAFDALHQSLRTSAFSVCNIKNDLTDLTTCVNEEAGLIDATQTDIEELCILTTANSNSALANKNAITLLNTCMSDLSTLSSNKIASIVTDIESINSNIDTVETNLNAEIGRIDNVSTCLETISSGLETSAFRVTEIENRSNANASSIDTINTGLTSANNNIANNAANIITLDSTLTTTTSVVQNLSSFRDVILQITDGKASASCASTLDSGITALNNSIGANHSRNVQLSSAIFALSSTILIPALTSINTTLIGKAEASCTVQLGTDLDIAELKINNLQQDTININSSLTALTFTQVSAISSSLPTTVGSLAYHQLTAKTDITTFEGLSSDITTCLGRFNYNDTAVRTVSAVVVGLSSNQCDLCSEIQARATCCDLQSLNTCMLDNFASIAQLNCVDSCINTTVEGIRVELQNQINFASGDAADVTNIIGGLRGDINSLSANQNTNFITITDDLTSLDSSVGGFSSQFINLSSNLNFIDGQVNELVTSNDLTLTDLITLSSLFYSVSGNLNALSGFTSGLSGNLGIVQYNLIPLLSGNFGTLSAFFESLSGGVGELTTDFHLLSTDFDNLSGNFVALSGFFNSLSGLTNTLNFSANNLESTVVLRLNTKASTTCTDGIAIDVGNAQADIGIIKGNTTFLSAELDTLSAFTIDLSGFVGARAYASDVCTLATNLETSASNVRALREQVTILDTDITSCLDSISATTLFNLNTASQAIVERASLTDFTALETVVTRQGVSATNLCTSLDSINTTISNVTGSVIGVTLESIQNLESRVNFQSAFLLSLDNQTTTINNNVVHGACAVNLLSSFFNTGITEANNNISNVTVSAGGNIDFLKTQLSAFQTSTNSCIETLTGDINTAQLCANTAIARSNRAAECGIEGCRCGEAALDCVNDAFIIIDSLSAEAETLISLENSRIDSLEQVVGADDGHGGGTGIAGCVANLNNVSINQNIRLNCLEQDIELVADQCQIDEMLTLIGCNQAGIRSVCCTAVGVGRRQDDATRNANEALGVARSSESRVISQICKLKSRYVLDVNAGGKIASMSLGACFDSDLGAKSCIAFAADCFFIGSQDSSTPDAQPFVVENNRVKIEGACIKNLSVNRLTIGDNVVSEPNTAFFCTGRYKSNRFDLSQVMNFPHDPVKDCRIYFDEDANEVRYCAYNYTSSGRKYFKSSACAYYRFIFPFCRSHCEHDADTWGYPANFPGVAQGGTPGVLTFVPTGRPVRIDLNTFDYSGKMMDTNILSIGSSNYDYSRSGTEIIKTRIYSTMDYKICYSGEYGECGLAGRIEGFHGSVIIPPEKLEYTRSRGKPVRVWVEYRPLINACKGDAFASNCAYGKDNGQPWPPKCTISDFYNFTYTTGNIDNEGGSYTTIVFTECCNGWKNGQDPLTNYAFGFRCGSVDIPGVTTLVGRSCLTLAFASKNCANAVVQTCNMCVSLNAISIFK